MNNPYYRTRWGTYPRRPQQVPTATPKTTPPPPHNPKVVSIPVRFFTSNPKIPSPESATLIQKLWRGFRVRKTVKKLLDIQRALLETEKSISDPNTVEAIRNEEKERLKVNERLMSLLLKLDSIRGFDVAVRDLRKALTRRAILLQEKVDGIAASPQLEESQCGIEEEKVDGIADSPESECDHPQLEEEEKVDCPMEEEAGGCECDHDQKVQESVRDDERGEEGKRSREGDIVERMAEDNSKLMRLMADLLDRNELQNRMLSSLSARVGQLENAFACQKLQRMAKKKKKTRNPHCLDKLC